MNNTTYINRVFFLDLLRTIAILGVIAIHITGYFVTNYQTYEGVTWWFANVLNSTSRFAIPIFLMLSGALLLNGKLDEDPLTVAKRRIIKLGIPFIIWSIIYTLYKYLMFETQSLSVIDLAKKAIVEFASNDVYSHLWFMYVITAIYLVSPFIHRAVYGAQEMEIRYLLILWFVVTVCLFTIQQVYAHFNNGFRYPLVNIDIPIAAEHTGYFILGYYLYRFDMPSQWRNVFYWMGGLSLLVTPLATFLMTVDAGQLVESFYHPFAITNLFTSTALFLVCKHRSWEGLPDKLRVLIVSISAATFGIYFIHMIVQDLVMRHMDFGQSITLVSRIVVDSLLVLVVSFVIIKLFNLHQRVARYLGA
ncbi:acyltransferase [Veronia pacifica]|uniref:acyltransferase n=1 Tax=Veronia pacifica TaxID=1080227 RepID=UPI000AB517E1|nr:acyltransferase family protein [Veronia pacifica]